MKSHVERYHKHNNYKQNITLTNCTVETNSVRDANRKNCSASWEMLRAIEGSRFNTETTGDTGKRRGTETGNLTAVLFCYGFRYFSKSVSSCRAARCFDQRARRNYSTSSTTRVRNATLELSATLHASGHLIRFHQYRRRRRATHGVTRNSPCQLPYSSRTILSEQRRFANRADVSRFADLLLFPLIAWKQEKNISRENVWIFGGLSGFLFFFFGKYTTSRNLERRLIRRRVIL